MRLLQQIKNAVGCMFSPVQFV